MRLTATKPLTDDGECLEKGTLMEIRVDVDALRRDMVDEYGTAAFSGFPAAAADAWEVERMSGQDLCREAERRGIDLQRYQA